MPAKKPSNTPDAFQLPEAFASFPGLVTRYRNTLDDLSRFEALQVEAAAEVKTFSESGDVADLAAVGGIVARQAQLSLLPARVEIVNSALSQLDGAVVQAINTLRSPLISLANEIRCGYAENYAQRNLGEGIPLPTLRKQAFETLPKCLEVAGYVGFNGPVGVAEENTDTLENFLANLEAWTKERDTLKGQLGGDIPVFKEIARTEEQIAKTAEKNRFEALSPHDQVADLARQRRETVARLNGSDVSTLGRNAGEQSLADYQRMADRSTFADTKDPDVAKKRAAFLVELQHLQQIQTEQGKLAKQVADADAKEEEAAKKKRDTIADANRKRGEAAADMVNHGSYPPGV